MAVSSKKAIEEYLDKFGHDVLYDAVIFGNGFCEFSLNGFEVVRFEGVLISCYEKLISEHKNQSNALRFSTMLEF